MPCSQKVNQAMFPCSLKPLEGPQISHRWRLSGLNCKWHPTLGVVVKKRFLGHHQKFQKVPLKSADKNKF